VPNTSSLKSDSGAGCSSNSSKLPIHFTLSSNAFPTVRESIVPLVSGRSLDVVASNNLNADATFSQLQISGYWPFDKDPPGTGAASKNDLSR
jgi:hypothetical protein